MSRIGKSIEAENRLVVARGWGKGYWGKIASEYGVSFGRDGICGEGQVGWDALKKVDEGQYKG